MENENNYELLKELLFEIYFEDLKIPNLDYEGKNKTITQTNEEELSNLMKPAWIQYLGNSADFDRLKDQYQERYLSWKKQSNSFENVKNKSEMISFLKTYFQKSYLIGYELKEVTKNDIKTLIEYKKPKISKEFKGTSYIFDNFLIYTRDNLHVTLHIKFDSFREESFLLTAIFAFTVEKINDSFSLEMNTINKNYASLVLARDIMNKLEVNHYQKLDIFDFSKYNLQNNKNTDFLNDWVKNYPQFFITYSKRLLNANPETLIDELIEDLNNIRPNKEEKNEPIQTPVEWFQNLSQELKVFYKKGKELFLKSTKLLDKAAENSEKVLNKKEQEKRREKLTIEDFLFLFNKAMEVDLEHNKSPDEVGFRTFHQLFTEFLDKKKRIKKYEFIEPVSRGTFYNLIHQHQDELESLLEKNTDLGKGGGDAYRIIRISAKEQFELKVSLDNQILTSAKQIKEEIHEGLIYYKNTAYKKTIEIFKGILNFKKDELQRSTGDYYGILYYLGKSYLKSGNYKSAKDYFDKIYTAEENKIDAGFRLLECFYKLREYEQAKKLSIRLLDFLNNILNPFRSLYKKDILYKDELKFFTVKREELHPNLFHRDVFSKYLIMLNRSFPFRDFFSLKPRYEGVPEDYEKKLEVYKDIRNYLNINIHTYRKLILYRLDIQNYVLEIYRKKIFNLYLIDNDEDEGFLLVKEVNNYLKESVSNHDLKLSRINDFLQYLINFSRIYYKIEGNDVSEYIFKIFPDIGDKIKGYKYSLPSNTRFISLYLYFASVAMKGGNYKASQRDIAEKVNKPDLFIENAIIEVKNIVNLDLDEILHDVKKKLGSLEYTEKTSWSYSFNQWKYQIQLGVHRGEDHFKAKIQEYIDFCIMNNLSFYKKTIENLYKEFEDKIMLIKEINQQGREQAVNEILKKFYPLYDVKTEKENIDFSKKPDRFNFKFLVIQIKNKVFSIRNQDHGELFIEIRFFNSKITGEIYKEIVEEIKTPNTIKMELEQNSINLKFYKEIIPSLSPMDFGEYLDYFFFDFFDAFEISTNKIVFRYIEQFEERLRDFFNNQFVKEFKNPYFSFELKHNPEELYYLITINKKEVN
ncbi:hypothetical protein LCGC14_1339000 [marine sediment metagenome]|uniref:Uncharacterized protein n=1 Tax=marine sediment metagenome TaxID=412755 RepID=A0A0F9NGH5_9ZZZZ|nr:hypothetical protein [bacterium]